MVMSYNYRFIFAVLLHGAFICQAAAQDILDRNGALLQGGPSSPAQYVLPDTLTAAGARRLSFDAQLSRIVQEEVEAAVEHYQAVRGSAFVLDVNTGEILAMASVERFETHPPENGVPFNVVTQGLYEIGVSAKAITVATGLEAKVVKGDSVIDVRKPIKFGKYSIDDFHPARAKISLTDVVLKASNIGMVKIAEKLGTDTFKQSCSKFGQFDELKVDGLQTSEPKVPTYWSDLTSATVAYGHGLDNTPLQAGAVIAAMVNGGYLVRPTIYKTEQKDAVRLPVISEATSAFMREVMRKNVTDGTGTKVNFKDIKVGGLSSTANKAIDGKYDPEKVVTNFAAVVPADKPKYLVFTTLDEPKPVKGTFGHQTSGWNAAPLAGDIIEKGLIGKL
jgi:cell division protein FtsI (penicillin-binding protein 3)